MNSQDNSTKMANLLQEHLNLWNTKILPYLPKNIDQLAAQTNAMQRKRGIRCACDLLKIFFIYACSDFSFRILACAAHAIGISSDSDTVWRKRFSYSLQDSYSRNFLVERLIHDAKLRKNKRGLTHGYIIIDGN